MGGGWHVEPEKFSQGIWFLHFWSNIWIASSSSIIPSFITFSNHLVFIFDHLTCKFYFPLSYFFILSLNSTLCLFIVYNKQQSLPSSLIDLMLLFLYIMLFFPFFLSFDQSDLEIVRPYFLQVPGTYWGVPPAPAPHPPGGARCGTRCRFLGKKRGGTWVPLQVPPHSLKNACQVGW
jgi:hypothetical protein